MDLYKPMKYSVSYIGMPSLGDPMGLVSAVFPQYQTETLAGRASMEGSGYCAFVTFDTPQTPTDLGPLVKVEIIDSPNL